MARRLALVVLLVLAIIVVSMAALTPTPVQGLRCTSNGRSDQSVLVNIKSIRCK